MMRLRLSITVSVLMVVFADAAAPVDKPVRPQFFAGVVSRTDKSGISVWRKLAGRSPENHLFMIDSNTKMPKGGVKLHMRVTVRYQHQGAGDLALEIQIRPEAPITKAP